MSAPATPEVDRLDAIRTAARLVEKQAHVLVGKGLTPADVRAWAYTDSSSPDRACLALAAAMERVA
jgi:hypothetical protein